MLLTKTVKVKWSGSNKKWYESKGYKYTKIYDELEVKTEDLLSESHVLIEIKCDSCGVESKTQWKNYLKCVHEDGKYYCRKCAIILYGNKKHSKTILKKGKSFEQWCIENNRQDVLNRWDCELNECKPGEVNYSTHKKYYFKCPRGIHKSELKKINDITSKQDGSSQCKQCNSFAQWCIDNNRQDVLGRWDYELNKYSPKDISYGTSNKYWFKCPQGLHPSELKIINNFTNGSEGVMECNRCNSFAQYLINSYGDSALSLYWDYKKNIRIDPWEISWGSSEKVWIKCQNKSYHGSYDIICGDFVRGRGCPYCSHKGKKFHPLDSLGKLLEDKGLLNLWSEKNKKSPYLYPPRTKQKVWWKCSEGKHQDYLRSIADSNKYGFRCPNCVRERDESILQEKVRLYLENLGYIVLHEYKTLKCVNPKTKHILPFDNEIKELKLIIEVHGKQHYDEITGNWFNPNFNLHYQQVLDRYKKIITHKQGYNYLVIPYWTDNAKKEWKQLIDNKINQILDKELNINNTQECANF